MAKNQLRELHQASKNQDLGTTLPPLELVLSLVQSLAQQDTALTIIMSKAQIARPRPHQTRRTTPPPAPPAHPQKRMKLISNPPSPNQNSIPTTTAPLPQLPPPSQAKLHPHHQVSQPTLPHPARQQTTIPQPSRSTHHPAHKRKVIQATMQSHRVLRVAIQGHQARRRRLVRLHR